MAPDTRSFNKKSTSLSVLLGPSSGREKEQGKHAVVKAELLPCLLLEMPPEVRNRIYHYCRERNFDSNWDIPCALRKTRKTTTLPHRPNARVFFSLTQTCRQIRAEYRRLWLSASCVRIDFGDLDDFIATFYSQRGFISATYFNAPKLMLISWDHEEDKFKDPNMLLNVDAILKFRAFSPASTIKFVCRRLVEWDLPHTDCYYCGQCITCPEPDTPDSDEDEIDSLYDYPCSHESTVEAAYEKLDAAYDYLEPLNDFLANDNEMWLKAIRREFHYPAKVECTMGQYCSVPTIYLRFASAARPLVLDPKRMYSSACEYLAQVGITALKSFAKLDFVVGVTTNRFTRSPADGQLAIPTYDQTLVCGRTYKAPSTFVKPASTLALSVITLI